MSFFIFTAVGANVLHYPHVLGGRETEVSEGGVTFSQILSNRTNSLQPMLFQRFLTAYQDEHILWLTQVDLQSTVSEYQGL